MSNLLANSAADGRALPSLIKLVTTIGGARVVGAGLAFAAQVILANWLGAEALGIYFQALSIAAILAIIACLGLPSVTTRFVIGYRTTGRPRELQRFVRTSRHFAAVSIIIAMAISAAAVLWYAPRPDQTALLIGICTALPLAMMRLNGAVANASRQFQTAYLPDLLGRPVTIIAIALSVPAIGLAGSVELILVLHLLAAFALAFWQFQRIERSLDYGSTTERGPEPATGIAESRLWLAASLPLIPVALLTAAFADVLIIATSPFMLKADLAVFAVCLKLALLAGFSIQLVHQLILPDAAEAYAAGRTDELRRSIARANLISVALCVTITAIFVVAGEQVLGIFGPQFIAGKWCLVILSLSLIARALLGPASHVLILAGHEKAAVAAALVAVVALVCMSAVAVPALGIIGAGLVALAITMIWSGMQAWMVWKYTGVATAGLAGLSGR